VDTVDCLLQGLRRLLVGVLWLPRLPAYRLTHPQFKLRLRLHQPIQRERHRPHGQSLRIGQRKGPACGIPQLRIEHSGRERNSTDGSGVVGVYGLQPEPAGGETARPDPAAETLAHGPEHRMQNAEVVGIGGQGMDHVELGLPLRREHRPGIDSLGPGPKHPAAAAKDRAEGAFGYSRDFADEIELVILQPSPHSGIELGQHVERLRREEGRLSAIGHLQEQGVIGLLSHRGGCLTHQFVARDTDG
jgi:hypothetical protein